MLGEPGEDLHQPALEGLLVLGDRFPRCEVGRPRRQLRALRNPSQLFGPLEGALAVFVPAGVELALVFVGPLLRHLMRAVRGAARPIHQERLVGRKGLVLTQPGDRIVRQVLAKMVIIVTAGSVGVLYEGCVSDKARLVLRRFPCEKSVKVLEAVACGPIIKRACGGGVHCRGIVPLAPGPGVISIIVEHLGYGSAAFRDGAHIAVPVVRQLGDLTAGHTVMVPAGEQRRARGRTHRRCVKPVVGDPLFGDLVQGRCMNLAAVGVRLGRTDVINEHDENVRCILWQTVHGRKRAVNRLLHGPTRNAARCFGRERQDLLRAHWHRERRTQGETDDDVDRIVSHRSSPF